MREGGDSVRPPTPGRRRSKKVRSEINGVTVVTALGATVTL